MVSNVSAEELANAFKAEEVEETGTPLEEPVKIKTKKQKSPKFAISIVVFVIGLLALAGGLAFLLIKLNSGPATPDAVFLTSAKEWILDEETNCASVESEAEANCEGGSGVIWKFTEVGKGTLTTNNHVNDYDFVWAIEGDTLKIETDWLYTLNDEYKYELNQDKGVLTLKDGDKEIRFLMVKEELME